MYEFEQMEMQFFVRPGDEIKHYEFWKEAIEMAFISRFRKENYRFHDHEKLAHANAASDIEFNFPLIQRIRRDSLSY
jgi:glycyl-tRNA synthetase